MSGNLQKKNLLLLVLLAACTTPPASPTGEPDEALPEATAVPSASPSPTPTDTPIPTATLPPVSLVSFGRLAYVAFAPNDVEIYLYDEGAGSTQLSDEAGFSIRPVWSPDGRYLSYFYIPPGAEAPDLWVVDFELGKQKRRVTDGSAGFFSVPAWMKDSQRLVYWGSDPNDEGVLIFSLDVETGQITNLTPDYPKWNAHPVPSPVDELIVFVSDRPDGSSDKIWMMDAAGGSLQLIAGEEGSYWEHSYPAWSPDGNQIAFFRSSFMAEMAGGDEDDPLQPGLWVMALEDGSERLVFEMEASFAKEAPVWSPDGEWLAFQRGAGEETNLWLVSLADGTAYQLSDLPGEETGVVWSPDAQALLFTHVDAEGYVTLYLTSLDGSPPVLLFDGQDAGYAAARP